MDVVSKKIIEDTLVDVKFSGMSWYKDEGFFTPVTIIKGSAFCKTDQHKVFP